MTFTSKVMMVRPANFAFNAQTKKSNSFQSVCNESETQITQQAKVEFDAAVEKLISYGIEVAVVNDSKTPINPDAVFPNNWFSTHTNGKVYIYNMLARNRKTEVNTNVIFDLGYSNITDLREQSALVLEGTGSMVIDQASKVIYACLSDRTNLSMLHFMGKELGMKICAFNASTSEGVAIYHTNVMMFVMNGMVAICLESIFDANEREMVRKTIECSGRKMLELSLAQVNNFSGNMIQLLNREKQPVLVGSDTAWNSLTALQQKRIKQLSAVCTIAIPTIETIGGGSARCMIAELF